MSTWKKIAEAFGRAVENPSATKGGRRMVFDSKTVKTRPDGTDPRALETAEQRAFDSGVLDAATDLGNILEKYEVPDEARRIWDNYDLDFERAYGPRDAYNRALELAKKSDESRRIWTTDDAPLPSSAEEFEERYGFPVDGDLPDNSAVVQRQFDKTMASRTNKALKQNASDEWDEAFARRKQGVRDWYGKDYPQDMAEEGANAFEKQLWEYVDELKAKGVSAQDILNRIKGNN